MQCHLHPPHATDPNIKIDWGIPLYPFLFLLSICNLIVSHWFSLIFQISFHYAHGYSFVAELVYLETMSYFVFYFRQLSFVEGVR